MDEPPNVHKPIPLQQLIDKHRKIAQAGLITVIVLNFMSLSLWHFNLFTFIAALPTKTPSNPVTSLNFILLAFALYSLSRENKKSRNIGMTLALLVFLTAMIKFSSIWLGFDPMVDKWLYPDRLVLYQVNGSSVVMAPNTALAFLCLAVSLLLYRFRRGQKNIWPDCFAMGTLLIAFSSLIGYLYHSDEFYNVKPYVPMALTTAISFLLLSLAVLLYRTQEGLFEIFAHKYEGSRMVRFLLPFIIAIPVVSGLLRVYGERQRYYSNGFGVALYTVANIIMLLVTVWYGSKLLNTSSKALFEEMEERKHLEELLRKHNLSLERQVTERTRELLLQEQRFFALTEHSSDVIVIRNAQLEIVYVSPAIKKILGIEREELSNKTGFNLIHPDDLHIAEELIRNALATPGISQSAIMKVRRHNGSYCWMEGTVINLLNDEKVNGVVSNFHDITERVEAEEKRKQLQEDLLQQKIGMQRKLIQAAIEGQEKERKQIGMELHDHINQILASAQLYLGFARTKGASEDDLLEKSDKLIKTAIKEIRKLSFSLITTVIDGDDLLGGVGNFVRAIELTTKLRIHFQLPEALIVRLDTHTRIMFYRIIQEQLNNIVKHARARHVQIDLQPQESFITLRIQDDGIGFDPGHKPPGIGLSNIRSRVELLNGDMKITSAIKQGCTLLIRIPYPELIGSLPSLHEADGQPL